MKQHPESIIAMIDMLQPWAAVTVRAMFGGHSVYRDGIVFAIICDGDLYLKVNAQNHPLFEQAGCSPYIYQVKGKDVPMSYWSIPNDATDDMEQLRPWLDSAYAAALQNAAKKSLKTSKSK